MYFSLIKMDICVCFFFFSHTASEWKHALLHQESYRAGCIFELYSHAEEELIRFLIIFFIFDPCQSIELCNKQ